MTDEQTPIFGGGSAESRYSGSTTTEHETDTTQAPVYYGTLESSGQKYTLYAFISVSVIMVVVTFIIGIIRSSRNYGQGTLYYILASSLLGYLFIEMWTLRMIRKGDLDKEKAWILYLLGIVMIVESLLTSIVIMN